MYQLRILCGSLAFLLGSFLAACSSCDDPTCYNKGFSFSFVNEEGKGVNRGTFQISSVSDTVRLEANCTFKKDGDRCPLLPPEDSNDSESDEDFRVSKDVEVSVSGEAQAVGSSIVVTFTKQDGNNIVGPELVSIQVQRNSETVGALTRRPIYEKETPNGPDCAFCTYASEPLEIRG